MNIKMLNLILVIILVIVDVMCIISQHLSVGATHETNISGSNISLIFPLQLTAIEPTPFGMNANGLISLKLIDISHNSSITDWNSVKKNVNGVYMKATEGITFTDPAMDTYANGAIQAKIPIGFYHYFWPSTNLDYAKQQADYFYNAIKKYKYDFYPALDIEETNNQNASTITASVKAFIEEFNRIANQKLLLYCSPNFANNYLVDQSLTEYPLWIANYNVNGPIFTLNWSAFDVWQYEINVPFPGTSGGVDVDIATNAIYINIDSAPKW